MNKKKEPIPADGAEKTTDHSPSEEKKAEKLLQPGGRVLSLMFLAFGLVFFIQSVQLFQKNASISGYATFPLIVSTLLLILTVIDYIQNLKIKSEIAELSITQKIGRVLCFIFPRDTLIFLLMSISYFLLLLFGVPFIVASLIFLMATMNYLIPHQFLKNTVYAVILMAAIYAIFVLVFKVTLP